MLCSNKTLSLSTCRVYSDNSTHHPGIKSKVAFRHQLSFPMPLIHSTRLIPLHIKLDYLVYDSK
jgi:hypothetical protein